MVSVNPENRDAYNSETFPIVEIDCSSINCLTGLEKARFIVDRTTQLGIDPDSVVFTGFEGRDIVATRTFGDRNTTYGVSRTQFTEANDDSHFGWERISPLTYLGPNWQKVVPAVGAFSIANLTGDTMEPIGFGPDRSIVLTPNELQKYPGYIWWKTRDGSSLDTVAKVVFFLKGYLHR